MAIRIGDASWKPNWPGFATEIAEIVVQALVLGPNGFSNAVSALMRAFRCVRGNDSTEHVATQLVLGTLGYSISGILTTSRLGRKPDKAEAKALIEDVINRAELIADQQKILLDSNHLENPASFSLFQDAEKRIYHSLKPFQPKDSEYNIKALFRRFASEGMHRIRIRDPEYYYPVIEALSGPDTRADARVRAWAQYRSLLIKRFEEEPLFGEDPVSGVTLGQIYQPLRGWWDEDEEELAPNSDQAKGEKEQPFNIHRHIGMLDRLIQSWLDASDPTDRIRLISGGPGSGKSTYAKWLAAKLATELSWRVVFVPLQRLKGAGPLETRIDEYFRLQLDEPFNADTAPLSTLGRDGHSDWVIIFDGLDELAKEGPSSESAAQDFASALADWRGRVGSIPVRFIVLGRAPSMQEARKRLGLHGQGTLYVADMTPFPKEETSNNRKIVIHDPDKIKELDQRLEFWVKWAAAKGLPPSAPEAMTTEALSDLTKEPLLAYLLIFSGYVGEQWKEAAENRNRIYEEIFKQIWQRERTKDARAHLNELGSEGFNALMQCLGLAAWRGGGRTGDETTFIAVRDTFMQPALLDKATNCGAADLSNVAILFYTRKDEEGGKGYEFLHKSFGEYLTAKGLLSAFQRWGGQAANPESDFDVKEFLRRWLKLTGPEPITTEILNFLRNEVRLQAYKADKESPWRRAREWVKIAELVVDRAVRDGLPAHEGATNWRRAEAQERNAEYSLMGILDAVARAAYPLDIIEMSESAGGWVPGPVKISAFRENPLAFAEFLARNGSSLTMGWFVGTSYFYFGGDAFIVKTLSRLSLRGAQITGAILASASLEGADFSGARFIGATVVRANLAYSSLKDAQLMFSNFSDSNFEGADLRGVNIRDSYIEEDQIQVVGKKDDDLKKYKGKSRYLTQIMGVKGITTWS